MVHSVESGHNGEQCLRRTNVTGGLFATDMLLAGLHGHAQGLVAASVYRYTDNASRGRTFVGVSSGKKSRMRAAKAHGDTKALGIAQHYIGAH